MHRYENEDRATLLSMKFDNKEDGTYKADLRAEVGGESSLAETDEAVPTSGSGSKTSFEKNYQWIIKATPEKASNDKDTFMVSEIGLKLISFLNKVQLQSTCQKIFSRLLSALEYLPQGKARKH